MGFEDGTQQVSGIHWSSLRLVGMVRRCDGVRRRWGSLRLRGLGGAAAAAAAAASGDHSYGGKGRNTGALDGSVGVVYTA